MSTPKIGSDEVFARANKALHRLQAHLQNNEKIQPDEVKTALHALSNAVDGLGREKQASLFEVADQIRNSPSFATALGIYQTEFANLLQRIEIAIRQQQGTNPVKKLDDSDRFKR